MPPRAAPRARRRPPTTAGTAGCVVACALELGGDVGERGEVLLDVLAADPASSASWKRGRIRATGSTAEASAAGPGPVVPARRNAALTQQQRALGEQRAAAHRHAGRSARGNSASGTVRARPASAPRPRSDVRRQLLHRPHQHASSRRRLWPGVRMPVTSYSATCSISSPSSAPTASDLARRSAPRARCTCAVNRCSAPSASFRAFANASSARRAPRSARGNLTRDQRERRVGPSGSATVFNRVLTATGEARAQPRGRSRGAAGSAPSLVAASWGRSNRRIRR